MTIIPEWDNDEKTIIRVSFSEIWNWDEFHAYRAYLMQMLETVEHTVDVILDMRLSTSLPSGALRISRQVYLQPHPKIGVYVTVGINAMIRAIYKSFTLLYPAAKKKHILVDTIEQAYSIIADIQQNRQDEE